ncbi:MAG TPA: histone deacetylase [Solirubrobacteraceae bacterium]|nr:histone deacetylase [Solirubrobacteraceae bacterium]
MAETVRYWAHDRFTFPLPEGHRFPAGKYRLLRERLLETGLAAPADLAEPRAARWADLALVHEARFLDRLRAGTLTVREQRAIGLPWSTWLVERARRSAQGTVEAARDALAGGLGMNLGGGTHHAGRSGARGYCLVNDVALAMAVLRRDGAIGRAVVVDCDVHQGDGTADLLGGDPETFTLSLHCARNYPFRRIPSDLDVEIPADTGDEAYLAQLGAALDVALAAGPPRLAFYLAGADPWEHDALGRLALTKDGLRARDALILDRLRAAGAAVCVVLAGGYAPDIRDTVAINLATAAEVAARADGTAASGRLVAAT